MDVTLQGLDLRRDRGHSNPLRCRREGFFAVLVILRSELIGVEGVICLFFHDGSLGFVLTLVVHRLGLFGDLDRSPFPDFLLPNQLLCDFSRDLVSDLLFEFDNISFVRCFKLIEAMANMSNFFRLKGKLLLVFFSPLLELKRRVSSFQVFPNIKTNNNDQLKDNHDISALTVSTKSPNGILGTLGSLGASK